MSDIAPIFKGASGGKSDDAFVGIQDSFQDSQSIEIRTNPKGISLGKKLVKDSSTIVTEVINCYLRVSTTGDIMAFGASGGIYRRYSGSWHKNSNTVSGSILSAIEFNGYIYFTNSASLFRVALGSISDSMTVSTPYQSFTNGSSFHPMSVAFSNVLLIGDKFQVATLDTLGVWEANTLVISPELVIKQIKPFGSSVKIYSQYSGNATEVSFWDGISDSVQESITMNGVKIEQMINKDGVDMIITNGNLGVLDGYKQSKLKTISGYSTSMNSIEVKGNKLLFGGTGGVWVWSNLNKNYPEVLSFDYLTSNAITDTVGAIFFDGTDLYVSWSNGSTYGIDKLSTTYASTGYLTSRVYFGSTRTQVKASLNVLTAFAKLTGTDTIQIYYRYNVTGSYTLLTTLTASSVKATDYTQRIQLAGSWNFAEFKVVLNSGDGSTTPEFYELFLEFDNVKY